MTTQAEGGIDEQVRGRFFPEMHDGVFVDVGAGRPDFLSMSALYRELGWHVIAVEPNPVFCDAHRAAGHEVLQYACTDRDENDVPFEVVDSHGQPYADGRVSFESFSALAVKPAYRELRPDLDVERIVVDVRKLDTLLAEHAPEVDRLDYFPSTSRAGSWRCSPAFRSSATSRPFSSSRTCSMTPSTGECCANGATCSGADGPRTTSTWTRRCFPGRSGHSPMYIIGG